MRDPFHPKSWLGLLTEVVLIGLSVFLALVADQWRVHKEHRQEAEATLRYIHEEVMVNRDAVNKERPYHEKLSQDIGRFLESDGPKTRQAFDATVHFTGVHPVTFERTQPRLHPALLRLSAMFSQYFTHQIQPFSACRLAVFYCNVCHPFSAA